MRPNEALDTHRERERMRQIIEIRITEKRRVIRSNESSLPRLTFANIIIVIHSHISSRCPEAENKFYIYVKNKYK
jgi:hypothetical protein